MLHAFPFIMMCYATSSSLVTCESVLRERERFRLGMIWSFHSTWLRYLWACHSSSSSECLWVVILSCQHSGQYHCVSEMTADAVLPVGRMTFPIVVTPTNTYVSNMSIHHYLLDVLSPFECDVWEKPAFQVFNTFVHHTFFEHWKFLWKKYFSKKLCHKFQRRPIHIKT